MHLIGTENQAKAPTHVKEKPLKVCIISHSSRDEIYSYGYGATRVIAYALKSNSRAVFSFFDLKAGYGGAAQDLELIYNEQPDVLGLSVFIWNIKRVESILSEIRTRMPQIIVVLGGPSAPGYEILSTQPWLPDFIVAGEGELAFRSLLDHISDKSRTLDRVLHTPALQRRKGEFQPETIEQLPLELDPLFSPYLENLFVPPGELVYLETSRGCPNACAFCICGDRKHRLRFFSKNKIRQELRWALEKGMRKINLCDAAVNYATNHLRALVGAAHEADPGRELDFTFALHSDCLNPEQTRLLSQLNIRCATMGLNSITPATFAPARRAIDPARFRDSVRLLNELPNVNITILMGLPGDTVDGLKATLDYCSTLGVQINCYELRVFPGTHFFDHAADYDLTYDPAGDMKALSCFSYTQQDLDAMRELLFDYIKSGAPFVHGDSGE
jgi:radical SAM superfamily enzyme YgiQ (UPF0313 family)